VKEGLVAGQGRRPFDTVRGRMGYTEAHARVGTLFTPSTMTYRDASAVLKLVLEDKSKPVERLDRPAGVRSGFLTSLTELVTKTPAVQRGDRVSTFGSIPYVHGDGSSHYAFWTQRRSRFERDGRTFERVIRAGSRPPEPAADPAPVSSTAPQGDLTGIPILVSYQPKWWLQVDLVLQK
jgi:hypothetical protein